MTSLEKFKQYETDYAIIYADLKYYQAVRDYAKLLLCDLWSGEDLTIDTILIQYNSNQNEYYIDYKAAALDLIGSDFDYSVFAHGSELMRISPRQDKHARGKRSHYQRDIINAKFKLDESTPEQLARLYLHYLNEYEQAHMLKNALRDKMTALFDGQIMRGNKFIMLQIKSVSIRMYQAAIEHELGSDVDLSRYKRLKSPSFSIVPTKA